jgi:hypothetical protein
MLFFLGQNAVIEDLTPAIFTNQSPGNAGGLPGLFMVRSERSKRQLHLWRWWHWRQCFLGVARQN